MNLWQHHASLNQSTRSLRDDYSGHRARIMGLINTVDFASCTGATRIAVLGAGNCNDIDLPWLTERFDEVHLVDLDTVAIDFAHSGPGVVQNRVRRHCPVDVASPLLDILEPILEAEATDRPTDIAVEWIQQLQQPPPPLPIPLCDVVVSVGLLSQLMLSINQAFAHLPPQTFLPLLQTVRRQHFRYVLSMLRPAAVGQPGGTAVLGLDFVSSDTASQISKTPDEQLGSLAMQLIQDRNFFTGMNPVVSLQELRSIPKSRMIHVVPPWRWTLGPRQYLMMGAVLQNSGDLKEEHSSNLK